MIVRRCDNPRAFYALVEPFLLEREAENCFFLGHIPTLAEPTDVLLLAAVDDADHVVAVALMTPGRHMVTTRGPAKAAVALANYLHEHSIMPPGVQSPHEFVEPFAREWQRLTGKAAHSPIGMGVHQLTRVIPPPRPASGAMRTADDADVELLTCWVIEFGEAIGESHFGEDAREIAARWIRERSVVFWEDPPSHPVAMAAFAGRTPNGVRVNLVYTPAEFRNRGYASTLVATLSQQLLDSGRTFCSLYTDLANPTSNKIYRAIGYEPVAESVRYLFG